MPKLKHDRYLEDLLRAIRHEHDQILTNVVLYTRKHKRSSKSRRIAEIDVLATKDGYLYAYEVKCSYRITKAKKQLQRIKNLMPEIDAFFFFCGESGLIEAV